MIERRHSSSRAHREDSPRSSRGGGSVEVAVVGQDYPIRIGSIRTEAVQHCKGAIRRGPKDLTRAVGAAKDGRSIEIAVVALDQAKRSSEEHTSELQSPDHLVSRLLL